MNEINNKGPSVVIAGMGISLFLGFLYCYSIFKEAIIVSIKGHDGRFAWDLANLSDPYAVCCLMISFAMIFAGRVQDTLGPRITAIIGGILIGLGLIWSSLSYSLLIWILGFGILTGAGLGFSYASALPPAIKWFAPSKTGMITGIVVGGAGLAPVYIAPLSEFLINHLGVNTSIMIFGIGILIMICILAQFLVNPPLGYKPKEKTIITSVLTEHVSQTINFKPSEIIRTKTFYKLWLVFAISSGAGLMVIGNVAGIAKQSLGTMAWIGVVLMAIGNASGRIIAGMISDKIGRISTITVINLIQAVIMLALPILGSTNALFIVFASTLLGFNYGANLALVPASTKDFFGLTSFGSNYGLVFTAWGIGGFILPKVSQIIVASTGTFNTAYISAAILLLFSTYISSTIKTPFKK